MRSKPRLMPLRRRRPPTMRRPCSGSACSSACEEIAPSEVAALLPDPAGGLGRAAASR